MLLFFFIDLGAKLDFSTLGDEVWPAVVLSAFVLIGNPLIVMAIMGYMGYRKRTGFWPDSRWRRSASSRSCSSPWASRSAMSGSRRSG